MMGWRKIGVTYLGFHCAGAWLLGERERGTSDRGVISDSVLGLRRSGIGEV